MSFITKVLSGAFTATLTYVLYRIAGPQWAIVYVAFNQGWFEAKTWLSIALINHKIDQKEIRDEQGQKTDSQAS